MAPEHDEPPQYTPLPRAPHACCAAASEESRARAPAAPTGPRAARAARRAPGAARGWRRWTHTQTGAARRCSRSSLGWLALSLAAVPDQLALRARLAARRTSRRALDPAGLPAHLGEQHPRARLRPAPARTARNREPKRPGFGRSDTIMLIRTGGGHAARLSIPRDTVVEIPGHGLQKINAAHAFGGPAESIDGDQALARHPDQPPRGSQLRKLPPADRRDGRRRLHGRLRRTRASTAASAAAATRCGCPPGTHHLDGKQALALARTRENLCAPNADRPAARGTPAGAVQRDEEPAALAVELPAPAAGSPGTRRRRSSPT